MSFQFDHVVHFVKNPIDAIEILQDLGIYATEGGKHEHLGTYNTLSYFDLSYIEFLGVFNQQLVEAAAESKYSLRETVKENQYKDGLARFALRSKNLEAEAKRFKELGLEVYGPSPLSRTRPDGSVISWKLLFVGKEDENVQLPFFIEWDEQDVERKKDLIERQVIAEHPIKTIKLESVGIAVINLEDVVSKWSTYLNLEAEALYYDEKLHAKAQKLKLPGGDIVFFSPLEKGIVYDIIENGGEKPFLIHFTGAEEEKVIEVLGATYKFSK